MTVAAHYLTMKYATILGLTFLLATLLGAQEKSRLVEAATKPGSPYKAYPTRTLDDLPSGVREKEDAGLSQYGGLQSRRVKATGFFYPLKQDGRWWLVDPEGCLFLHQAVVSVAIQRTPGARAAFEKKFGNETNWAEQTTALLRAHGFNGLGAWTDTDRMRAVAKPLVYTRIWNFMSSYGKKRGGTYQKPGHTGYPSDCIFVFDPDFEKFCDEHAKQLVSTRNDPWLLGHFSDNEMPLKREALKNYLSLPETDPGHRAARAWLEKRHGAGAGVSSITAQDQADFLAHVVERYCRIVSTAIKKHDPNHLFLGSRFHGSDLDRPEVFKAAGPFLDVVAVNYYRAWTPDLKKMAMWEKESGRPCLITEWYAKGMDVGLANTGGAGWTVKTQRDRGLFYENFTLGLLESKACVGWHWFKYADNDPEDTKADPSNRDANKGIVSNRYEPYPALLEAMKRINQRTYRLVDFFDRKP